MGGKPLRAAVTATIVGCLGAAALSACTSGATGAHAAHPKPASTAGNGASGGSAAPGHVHALHASTEFGSVTVTGTSGTTVVDEQVGGSLVPAPHKLVNGTLTVGSAAGRHSYSIKIPRSTAISVTTTDGAITLASLAGQVQATAANGTISGRNLSAAYATFSSHTGAIDTSFATPPSHLTATARNGTVILRVPRTASYTVNARSAHGVTEVLVPRSGSTGHVITATTGSGAVMVVSG